MSRERPPARPFPAHGGRAGEPWRYGMGPMAISKVTVLPQATNSPGRALLEGVVLSFVGVQQAALLLPVRVDDLGARIAHWFAPDFAIEIG